MRRRAGVLVPLFSVYSKESAGVGELGDLRILIDWCKKTENSILQLLPMNETGSLFCPYDSISSFALEPVYISLGRLSLSGKTRVTKKIKDLKKLFPCGSTYVDYGVKKEKIKLLAESYAREKSVSEDFEKFKKENLYWLDDFALYKALKDFYNGYAWWDWQDKYKKRDPQALKDFKKERGNEIGFHMWVQWQLYKQFKEAKDYAQSQGVFLKGDLPILVSLDSADVWAHPEFFKAEFAAGAPPDMYCAKGQRWGMPTSNWENIKSEGFEYLRQKLSYAQNFYHMLRIDHVVGLFRIWSIPCNDPLENQGLNGFFDPPEEEKWDGQGREILSVMLKNTDMLLCAEDLGVVPKACTDALKDFGIPGNDVQRWIKDWKVKHDFLEPKDYRVVSVAILSTHDTTNWPAWWENEAGTVDEALFKRKCSDQRWIDFAAVKDKLFDPSRSRHGRLRWEDGVDSADKLVVILGRKKEELSDFVDLYDNTYQEKEKLWKHLRIEGPMREKCDAEIMRRALKISLDSSAIFCINTIVDWLYLSDVFKGDPYQYRINFPGTISEKNWSLTIPLSLEKLFDSSINKEIKSMIISSGR